jgi:uncharacterized membrane protein
MYNRIAGQSLERIAALSDGLFAIAMTLIVLEIHVPVNSGIGTDGELWQALLALTPRFTTYLLSFLTLGIFWTGQQTQLNFFSRADRDLAWIHFGFLAVVSLLPFSTTLLAEFIGLRLALLLYWANILALGTMLYASWAYASRAGLVKDTAPPGISAAIKRRILVAQALYALGALLCVVSTTWSIGFIVLVQLNYAVAPRIRWLYGAS